MVNKVIKARKVLYKYLIEEQYFTVAGLLLGMLLLMQNPDLYTIFAIEMFSIGPLSVSLITLGQWGILLLILGIMLELIQGFAPGGSLQKNKKILPLASLAAVGGVLVPVGVYISIIFIVASLGYDTAQLSSGWPIVCATDIVFAILLSNWFAKKHHKFEALYLQILAVFDDILMLVVIVIGTFFGMFESHAPHVSDSVKMAAQIIIGLIVLYGIVTRYFKVSYSKAGLLFLVALTFGIGYCMELLGFHGVLASLLVFPFLIGHQKGDGHEFLDIDENSPDNVSWLEHQLKMPTQALLAVFGFTSAVPLSLQYFNPISYPLPYVILVSVLLGKRVGISLFHKIFAKVFGYKEPLDIGFVGINAGVGFTVAIFASQLIFQGELLAQATLGCVLTFPVLIVENIIRKLLRKNE